MFAVCKFMDSENVKTSEMSVEKERRLSDFDKGNFGGQYNYAMSLQNGKFSGRTQIEAAEDLKHFCKICQRRFACGRALGGHMRIHGNTEKSNPSGHMRIHGDSEKSNPSGHMRIHGDGEKSNPSGDMRIHGDSEKSNPSGHMGIHGESEKSNLRVISTEAAINGWCEAPVQDETDLKKSTNHLAYALRTNRKRSWVLTEQSGALFTGMFEDGRPALMVTSSRACDECGKEFSSWKALLAHMKCSHSGNPEQILEQEKQNPVSQIQLRPTAKGKRSKRVKCPDDCDSQYNEEEDMANCLVMLAMAGKSSSLEKPTKVIQAKTKFSDKIDGIGVIQGKTEFPDDSDKIDAIGVIEGKTKFGDKIDGIGKQYKCRTCQRVFSSFQALGGHRASNHHYNCSASPRIANESSCSEEEIGTGDEPGEIKPITEEAYSVLLPERKKWSQEVTYNGSSGKGKLHECSICERKFSSGQALGGHKRCHRTTSTAMIHCSQMQESVEHDKKSLLPHYRGQLIDLNLPASCHDDQYEPEHSDKAAEPIRSDLVNNFFSEIDFGKYLFPFYSQPWRIHKDGFLSLPEKTQNTHMNVVVGPDDEAESIKREFD